MGDFLSGVVAGLLSTPCSAPFLGTAMSFAMSCDNISIILIFITAGFGFSAPYWLLIIYPQLLYFMPKPGKWMVYVKKIIAILLIITLLWLCNILYEQTDLRAITGLVLLLLLLKFVIENSNMRILMLNFKVPLIAIIIAACLYLPSMAYNEDLQHDIKASSVWRAFDQTKIAQLVNKGHIVIVDITAAWCTTCKFNQLILWNRNKTINLFKIRNIVAMRADYTNFDQAIQSYLASNQSYGIPFNKIYGPKMPQGITLPSIIFYKDLLTAISAVSK